MCYAIVAANDVEIVIDGRDIVSAGITWAKISATYLTVIRSTPIYCEPYTHVYIAKFNGSVATRANFPRFFPRKRLEISVCRKNVENS